MSKLCTILAFFCVNFYLTKRSRKCYLHPINCPHCNFACDNFLEIEQKLPEKGCYFEVRTYVIPPTDFLFFFIFSIYFQGDPIRPIFNCKTMWNFAKSHVKWSQAREIYLYVCTSFSKSEMSGLWHYGCILEKIK